MLCARPDLENGHINAQGQKALGNYLQRNRVGEGKLKEQGKRKKNEKKKEGKENTWKALFP